MSYTQDVIRVGRVYGTRRRTFCGRYDLAASFLLTYGSAILVGLCLWRLMLARREMAVEGKVRIHPEFAPRDMFRHTSR